MFGRLFRSLENQQASICASMAHEELRASAATKTSFTTTRISKTTFLITEDDIYGEHPFIYAKQHPTSPVLILSDTGCNAPRSRSADLTCLRTYLETYPIPELDGEPINPLVREADGNVRPERRYVVICTHCHYDHIGGIEAFAGTPGTAVVASAHDRAFLTEDLETHFLGGFARPPMRLPRYEVSQWVCDGDGLSVERVSNVSDDSCGINDPQGCSVAGDRGGNPSYMPADTVSRHKTHLGITFVPTPGHTPDSLAWFDEAEMTLYTGDSFYERFCEASPHGSSSGGDGTGTWRNKADMPIIFPAEGDLVTFSASLQTLLRRVRRANRSARAAARREEQHLQQQQEEYGADAAMVAVPRRVRVGAAHQTFGRDAEEMLGEVITLFGDIVAGVVPVRYTTRVRGEENSLWMRGPEAKYKVFMPNRLVDEAVAANRTRALFQYLEVDE